MTSFHKNARNKKIDNYILQLFDYTKNQYAYNTLVQLLSTYPSNKEGCYERQDIIKGIQSNERNIKSFAYYKADFEDAYIFCRNIISDDLKFSKNIFVSKIKSVVDNKSQQQLQNKTAKLILLLNDIYKNYFLNLNTSFFPTFFARKVEMIKEVLISLELNKYAQHILNDSFNDTYSTTFLRGISQEINKSRISVFWEYVFLFESYLSISIAFKKNNFSFPEFNENQIQITEFYFPTLTSPIKNSITINKSAVLLTGPNMSGKSTLLKTIGLCITLSKLGIGVPAQECTLPFFDEVYIFIDSEDDIENGYSHFMIELNNLKTSVKAASDGLRVFAIFDELFKGTNIDDALEISIKTINGLAGILGSHFMISTHLFQLMDNKLINQQNIEMYYIECIIDNNTPVFTYKVKKGWSDLKIGKFLFENSGIPELLYNQMLSSRIKT